MGPIYHKKSECIGCNSCVEIAPQLFEMDEAGIANLLHKTAVHGPFEVGELFDEDAPDAHEAAEACPVQIIHTVMP